MNMYHVDSCEFEIRTRIYKAIGYEKKSTVQYSLYQYENIERLTAELLSEKESVNIQIEE